MTMTMRHDLRCRLSGLVVGHLEVKTTAGCLPYLSHWDACIVKHPVFSMSTEKLLRFSRDEWSRLAQRATDEEIGEEESETLRVAYLAILHTLDCVKQDAPALPPLAVVVKTIQQLFVLSYWKWKLESERFSFPTLHLNSINRNLDFSNIDDYLLVCFNIRRDYEKKVREVDEVAKVKAAQDALVELNNTWIAPASKKVLFQWICSNLPEQYQPDGQGWLRTLFLGSDRVICTFEEDSIQLCREIIESSCPNGTGVMFVVRKRLDAIDKAWNDHFSSYEIEMEDYAEGAGTLVNGEKTIAPDPGPEPVIGQFLGNKARYYVTHAKWQIAKAAWKKDNQS